MYLAAILKNNMILLNSVSYSLSEGGSVGGSVTLMVEGFGKEQDFPLC